MNKKIRVTSLAAAALTSLFLASTSLNSTVKADEKDEGTNIKSQSAIDSAKADVANSQKEVDNAQADVNSAQSALDQANSEAASNDAAYNAQATKAQAAKNDADNKNAKLEAAKKNEQDAQKLVDEATPANIDKAKNDVKNQQNNVIPAANDAKKAADQAVADKKQDVNDKQAAVNDAQNIVKTKQDAKNTADENVKVAEDALKGTGIAEAQNQVNVYQKNVDNLNKNIRDNQNVLSNNQKSLEQAQNNAKTVAQQIKDAKNQVSVAENNLSTKKAAVVTANNLAALKQEIQNNKASGAAAFFKSILDDKNSSAALKADAQKAYDLIRGTDDDTPDWYSKAVKLGQDGDATSFDKLTAELDHLDDVNKARQVHGKSEVGISLTDLAYAMINADYQKIIPSMAHSGWNPGSENIAGDTSDPVGQWMSEEEIWNQLLQSHPEYSHVLDSNENIYNFYLEHTNEYEKTGHFLNLLNPELRSFGMALSPVHSVVFDGSDEYPATYSVSGFKTAVNNYVANIEQPEAVKALEDKINDANENEKQAEAAVAAAEGNVTTLQQRLTDVNAQISNINKAIQEDHAVIKSAQDKLNEQNAKLAQAQHNLSVLTADNATKAHNLQVAQNAQAQAKAELDTAQGNLKNAQNNLTTAQSELKNLEKTAQEKADAVVKANNDLTILQKHVSDLQNAPQILSEAKTAVAQAQKDYDVAKKAADAAQAELQKLAPAKDSADAQVASAQATYDAAQRALKVAQDKLASAKENLEKLEKAEQIKNTLPSTETKTIILSHNARVYDKNGKALKSTLKKKAKLTALNGGRLVTIKGKKYYQIGKNKFIKAGNVAKKVNKTVKKASKSIKLVRLTHNALVYSKSGKAIRKGLHFKFVKRGKTIKVLNKGKVVTIKGKKFYQISKNEFVKVANSYVKTDSIHVQATVKGSKKVNAYNRSGELNKHFLKAHHVYTFNEKKAINGKTYYKVKWTNDWVPTDKLQLKK